MLNMTVYIVAINLQEENNHELFVTLVMFIYVLVIVLLHIMQELKLMYLYMLWNKIIVLYLLHIIYFKCSMDQKRQLALVGSKGLM